MGADSTFNFSDWNKKIHSQYDTYKKNKILSKRKYLNAFELRKTNPIIYKNYVSSHSWVIHLGLV